MILLGILLKIVSYLISNYQNNKKTKPQTHLNQSLLAEVGILIQY